MAAASAATSPATAGNGVRFFAADDLNFQIQLLLGLCGYGGAEVGEVLAAVDRINAAGAGYQTFVDEFRALSARTAKAAALRQRSGHVVSARAGYLRAASYGSAALTFVLGTADPSAESTVFAQMRRCWESAAALFDPPIERVAIEYEGGTVPGYLLRADRSVRPRPTVILNNGSDGQSVELYAFGAAAALERGYHALIVEGPGQGSMLFERDLPLRYDWEHFISPMVDWLHRRREVDRDRIALVGWSLCGESVTRAAAFEHRLAAVCMDPGIVDVWDIWEPQIGGVFMPGAGRTRSTRCGGNRWYPTCRRRNGSRSPSAPSCSVAVFTRTLLPVGRQWTYGRCVKRCNGSNAPMWPRACDARY
ncbi:hypothetical protein [Actinoplanes sp. NPDC089786]|uniref:alpha/beta hydrolase family protein n=1 Tax=Actinoplanes sp. NPDC089786 TaxID=3155185 RepID=UPI003414C1B1